MTTKTGGLPNLSYIFRKLEFLGTDCKNLVNDFQGEAVWKDIMEGKNCMSKKEYSNLGGTTVCVMRSVTST